MSGTVTNSEENSPVPGVHIMIKGTQTGTSTDANGKYALSASPDATLVFSAVGMKTREIPVNGMTLLDVVMEFDVIGLADDLNMTARMRRPNVWYNESDALVVVAQNISNPDKWVIFAFNNWAINQHHITINVNSSNITYYYISGYIKNRMNASLYNVSVTIIGDGYNNSDVNGYYNITSNFGNGNYTMKAILFPYSNKTMLFTINNSNISNFNFTMNVPTQAQPEESSSALYIIIIMILSALYLSRTKQYENFKDEVYGYFEEEKKKRGKNNE